MGSWDNGRRMDLPSIGRSLLVLGVVIAVLGMALILSDRVPYLGRLPGDVQLGGERWTIYIPIATSILLSVVLTLVLSLFGWLGTRR